MALLPESARDVLIAHPQAGNITYRGPSGDVETIGAVVRTTDVFGVGPVNESRYYAVFLTEDIASPMRGDQIIDASEVTWVLQERRSDAGQYIDRWSVTRRGSA